MYNQTKKSEYRSILFLNYRREKRDQCCRIWRILISSEVSLGFHGREALKLSFINSEFIPGNFE